MSAVQEAAATRGAGRKSQGGWLEWRVFNRLDRSASSMTRLTVPDHQIGNPTFAINIVVRPSPDVMQALVALQDRIEALAPAGAFLRVPAATLHLSIFQLVWARTQHVAIGPQEWLGLEAETFMALQALASRYEPFVLHQGQVLVGEKAIYLQFSPSAAMDRLRDEIEHHARDRFPGRHRPQIQHITLFRYRQAVPLAPLAHGCAQLPPWQQAWSITQMELGQESAYPLLASRTVGNLALGSSET